jgi:hypothetical protein
MLAQVAQGWSPTTVVQIVAGALGGTGILATLLLVAAKGYWVSTVAPLVESEVRKWYHHPDQVEARAKERALSFKDWYDKREQHEEREKELQNLLRTPSVVDESTKSVKLIIDNEIKRSDGLISREITTKVNDMESRLLTKLEEMAQLQRDDTLFKQKMLQEMGQLKGAINTMLPSGQLASVSPTPPERKPR